MKKLTKKQLKTLVKKNEANYGKLYDRLNSLKEDAGDEADRIASAYGSALGVDIEYEVEFDHDGAALVTITVDGEDPQDSEFWPEDADEVLNQDIYDDVVGHLSNVLAFLSIWEF